MVIGPVTQNGEKIFDCFIITHHFWDVNDFFRLSSTILAFDTLTLPLLPKNTNTLQATMQYVTRAMQYKNETLLKIEQANTKRTIEKVFSVNCGQSVVFLIIKL